MWVDGPYRTLAESRFCPCVRARAKSIWFVAAAVALLTQGSNVAVHNVLEPAAITGWVARRLMPPIYSVGCAADPHPLQPENRSSQPS